MVTLLWSTTAASVVLVAAAATLTMVCVIETVKSDKACRYKQERMLRLAAFFTLVLAIGLCGIYFSLKNMPAHYYPDLAAWVKPQATPPVTSLFRRLVAFTVLVFGGSIIAADYMKSGRRAARPEAARELVSLSRTHW